jgi:HD domain
MTIATEGPTPIAGGRRWQRRPLVSGLLRFIIVLVPLSVACVVGVVSGMSVSGNGVGNEILRLLVALVVSLVTFVAVDRLARRLLPLATLLKLSLVFPDRAPSRFSVALRSSSVKKLHEWARSAQHDEGPAALAEKVVTLAAALNTHDRRTRGHSERSRATAEMIAVEMGLTEVEINEVRWGAFLHDIGKILVPATLLNKAGRPTSREWETLKRHPADGGDLVEPLRGFLGSGVEAVRGHHENYDGSGYPVGLSGDDIALAARIVSVADSFEVMTAVRSYKKPMKAIEAREELARHSGTQFDPAVVRALLNVSLGRLHWSLGLAAWAAELPFLGVLPRVTAQVGAVAVGPTVSMTALTGIAAISLGSVIAPATMVAAPANPVPAGSVSSTRSAQLPVTSVPARQEQSPASTASVSSGGASAPDSAANGTSGTSSSAPTPAPLSADANPSTSANELSSLVARAGPTPSVTPTTVSGGAQSVVPASPEITAAELAPPTPSATAELSVASDLTGNPHPPGTTGDPDAPGTTGDPQPQ